MCGIAGIFHLDKSRLDHGQLMTMGQVLRHRGPDDEGLLLLDTASGSFKNCHGPDSSSFVKEKLPALDHGFGADLGFAFRRLSIVDLSEKGHQPMSSADEQCWLEFNGEIYNYIEIREELRKKGYRFASGTDTEVIIYAYQEWGVECLNRFNGMWAFALWDNRTKTLFCARDRFGVKPFFYHLNNSRFVFSSEIKALFAAGAPREVDGNFLNGAMKVPVMQNGGADTFFSSIKALPNAHYLLIRDGAVSIKRYYDLPITAFEKNTLSYDDAVARYRELFEDSIRLRMRSDVEVGACLSGGLDSSAIVCLAYKHSPHKFKTFSAYYTQPAWMDERKWINLVTETTGSVAHFVSPAPHDVVRDLEKITWHHDYPVPGSSPFTQYYVMKLAHENGITVLLDGQGSDEIASGYNHAFLRYYADLIRGGAFKKFWKEFPDFVRYNQKGNALSKVAKVLAASVFDERKLYSLEYRHNEPAVIAGDFTEDIARRVTKIPASKLANFSYNITMNFFLSSLLHVEDRNSMAWSIESRVPFLDYRLVEFLFSLPASYKIKANFGKRIHRDAMNQLVPEGIVSRKDKVSFSAPGENFWLRHELKNFFSDMIHSRAFRERSIYQVDKIQRIYKNYLDGDTSKGALLWRVMALETWFKTFIDKNPAELIPAAKVK